jgi:uncharacterized protein YuzE
VDSYGIVTGIKAGTATITVTTVDGKKKATCKVTVKNVPVFSVTGISLNRIYSNIDVGSSITLIATINPSNATNKQITWLSSNPKVATVDENGKVVGIKSGLADITVVTADGNKTATCLIAVSNVVNVKGISLNKSVINITVGGNETLVATITPNNASNRNITWNSSDQTIASVDENGNVIGVKEGLAIITATTVDGNKQASCIANILPVPKITFRDPNFEKAIRNCLNKPTGEITQNDVLKITELSIGDRLVYDISGIENLTNLTSLSLYESAVSDISPLSKLTNLISLSLFNNQIEDITPLKGLINLRTLDLENGMPEFFEPHQNHISDLSALSGLTNLWYLNVASNDVSNVEPLKNLSNLTILTLSGNPISDADIVSLKQVLVNCSVIF